MSFEKHGTPEEIVEIMLTTCSKCGKELTDENSSGVMCKECFDKLKEERKTVVPPHIPPESGECSSTTQEENK